jgi:plasmid stabilization system protein ParE
LNKVIWSNPALGHLRLIRAYIEQFNPRAAQELAAALVEAGNNLEHFPHCGRSVSGTDKRELVTAYPYIIRYRIVGNTVRILRVRHTARRPTNP